MGSGITTIGANPTIGGGGSGTVTNVSGTGPVSTTNPTTTPVVAVAMGAPTVAAQSDAGTATAGSANTLIRTDAQHLVTTAVPGTNVQSDAASVARGTSTAVLRADAGLIVTTAVPGTNVQSDAASAARGTSSAVLRADAGLVVTTAVPGTNVQSDAASAARGASTSVLRADAGLIATTAAPLAITSAANAQGSATSLARSDHLHNLPFSVLNTVLGTANAAIGFNQQSLQNYAINTLLSETLNSNPAADWTPTGFGANIGALLIQPNGGSRTIAGLTGGWEGRILYILSYPVDGTSSTILSNADGSATPTNRIEGQGNATQTLAPYTNTIMLYTQSRWRVCGH